MSHAPRYVIKGAQIAALPARERAHRLNPNGLRREVALGDAAGLTGLGCYLVTLAPGRDSTEPHSHSDEDEAAYVLEGSGELRLGEERVPIAAGDFIGYPKGGPAHVVTNTGDRPLTYLLIAERAPFDVVDYPARGKRVYRRAGAGGEMVDVDAVQPISPPPPFSE